MIQIDNVLKIVDIQKNQVSEDTFKYLSNFITYTDNVLDEHIINIQDAIDDVNEDKPEYSPSSKTIKEVKELQTILNDNEAGYVRFIEG
jgi:hypothetical protein